jgi:hypothetical protein
LVEKIRAAWKTASLDEKEGKKGKKETGEKGNR